MLYEITANAIATGLMLGSAYAALCLGLAITFGILKIPNMAHPAFVVSGAFFVMVLNRFGVDPILASGVGALLFYFFGIVFYEFYRRIFERSGTDNTLQSLTLYFGVALVIEVLLAMAFGTDLQSVSVWYVGKSLHVDILSLPYRLLIPAIVSPIVIFALWIYLTYTRSGLAIRAVASGELPLRISGIDATLVKRHAFGLAMAVAVIAGGMLIVMGPIDPFAGRLQIGRVFAIVILAGMTAIPGLLVAAALIGVAEALVTAFFNPSWAPGVAFAILIGTLAVRPSGLFGNR